MRTAQKSSRQGREHLIIQTPGGLVLAANCSRGGGTSSQDNGLRSRLCNVGGNLDRTGCEIVLGEFSVVGPIDLQIAGLPAASIAKARDSKSRGHVFDLTFVLADAGGKSAGADQTRRG